MSGAAERVERTQWDLFWLPPDVRVTDRPELLYITCPRSSPYLNAVLRTRAHPDDLPGLVAEVERVMAGRRARWLVPDTFDPAPLQVILEARGWAPTDIHDVRVLAVDAWTRTSAIEVHAVDSMARLHHLCDVADAAFGRPSARSAEEMAVDLRACTEGGRVHRFVGYVDGVPVASGGLTAFPDTGFGFLWAGGVVPGARGRGAYLAVLAARIERARALGLREVGLYAKQDTSSPILAALGFGRHGGMTYWERSLA